MVVATWRRQLAREVQATRHAQVNQQQARIEWQQEVLAAPANLVNTLSHQGLRRHAQRPAQWQAGARIQHGGTPNAVGKAAPGNLDFGQFRHDGAGSGQKRKA